MDCKVGREDVERCLSFTFSRLEPLFGRVSSFNCLLRPFLEEAFVLVIRFLLRRGSTALRSGQNMFGWLCVRTLRCIGLAGRLIRCRRTHVGNASILYGGAGG